MLSLHRESNLAFVNMSLQFSCSTCLRMFPTPHPIRRSTSESGIRIFDQARRRRFHPNNITNTPVRHTQSNRFYTPSSSSHTKGDTGRSSRSMNGTENNPSRNDPTKSRSLWRMNIFQRKAEQQSADNNGSSTLISASASASVPSSSSSSSSSSSRIAQAQATMKQLLSSISSYLPSSSSITNSLQTRALGLLHSYLLTNLPKRDPAIFNKFDRSKVRVRLERGSLSEEEIGFIRKRTNVTRQNMSRYLARQWPEDITVGQVTNDPSILDDDTLPTLGIACSGGGLRASLGSMGALTSLQQQGLFDSASYITGLSGGTWAMAQIYANERHIQERVEQIQQMKEKLMKEEEEYNRLHTARKSPQSLPDSPSFSVVFDPRLHSPVDLKRLSEELMTKVSVNLFSQIPLELIKSCLIDRWSLYESEVAQRPLTAERREEIEEASKRIVNEIVNEANSSSSQPSSSDLTLPAFIRMLQSIGLSDSFGWALTHKLLNQQQPSKLTSTSTSTTSTSPTPLTSPLRHTRLSDQIDLLNQVSLPYPIYAAITFDGLQWEFTPHECGFPTIGAFIPSWALGQQFEKGKLVHTQMPSSFPSSSTSSTSTFSSSSSSTPTFPPNELSFGLLLACFASAFPTRIGRILEEVIYNNTNSTSEPLLKYVHKILHENLNVGHESAFQPAQFPNFMKGMEQQIETMVEQHHHPESSASSDPVTELSSLHPPPPCPLPPSLRLPAGFLSSPTLSVMDAGLQSNLPLAPLLRPERGVDLIIAFDQSSPPEANACDALRICEEYAHRFGYPCPDMSQSIQPLINSHENGSLPSPSPSPSSSSSSSLSDTRLVRLHSSLVRASNASVSVFEGDATRHIPWIIYFPLIANPKVTIEKKGKTKENGANWSSSSSSSRSSSPPLTPSVPFDPRANFLAGGFCATLNFQYQLHESEILMSLTYHNCQDASGVIRDCIEKIRQQKIERNKIKQQQQQQQQLQQQ